jgi:cysteine synthase A
LLYPSNNALITRSRNYPVKIAVSFSLTHVKFFISCREINMLIDSILEAVGKTPLVRLKSMSSGNVFGKAEFLNPGGSVKDRVAKHIIEEAEKEGKLKAGMTIIEATSGNTGIGLSLVGVQKGYKVICLMP